VAHRQKCLHTYMDGFWPVSVSTSVIGFCFRSLRPGYLSVTSVLRASTGFWVVVWRRLGTLLYRSDIIVFFAHVWMALVTFKLISMSNH
jgi:hypothetical protein